MSKFPALKEQEKQILLPYQISASKKQTATVFEVENFTNHSGVRIIAHYSNEPKHEKVNQNYPHHRTVKTSKVNASLIFLDFNPQMRL